MAGKTEATQNDAGTVVAPAKAVSERKSRKDVPGNFSYTNTPGRFKETLQAIIGAERPPTFNRDFIETVLNVKGGAVSGFPPILKRLGFLAQDNSPTELYGQFQADSSRSSAALAGLRNGFGELFKRNAHVHKADDAKVKDYLVQITGRKKDDPVVNAILGTFNHLSRRTFEKTMLGQKSSRLIELKPKNWKLAHGQRSGSHTTLT